MNFIRECKIFPSKLHNVQPQLLQFFNFLLTVHHAMILGNCLLVYSQPAHDTATNTQWQLPEAVLIQFVFPDEENDMLETCRELEFTPNQHTTQPPTRCDNYQKLNWYNLFLLMMSMTCSKHVENYKEINTFKGICASSWTVTKNYCMNHGQQNVKFVRQVVQLPRIIACCTVNKTLNLCVKLDNYQESLHDARSTKS